MQKTWWVVVALVGLTGLLVAQSVADVARKSREQSQGKKSRVVITDDMLCHENFERSTDDLVQSLPSQDPAKARESNSATREHYAQLYEQIFEEMIKAAKGMQVDTSRGRSRTIEQVRKGLQQLQEKLAETIQEARANGVPDHVFYDVRSKFLKRLRSARYEAQRAAEPVSNW